VSALVSVRTENEPGSNWVCRNCRRREPRASERTNRTLERKRAYDVAGGEAAAHHLHQVGTTALLADGIVVNPAKQEAAA
jgi:hypothetical protein